MVNSKPISGSTASITLRPARRWVMKSSPATAEAPALAAPTQPKTLAKSARRKPWLRLARATADINTALQDEYNSPKAIVTSSSSAACAALCSDRRADAACKIAPQMNMLTVAMVALPSRVDQRLELRQADTSPSRPAAMQPAGVPCISSNRTMKTSPKVNA